MELTRWEYRVITFKNPQVKAMEQVLSGFGVAGWELVSFSTTVKTWVNLSGNDLVAVFKRPMSEPPDPDFEPQPVSIEESGWM